MAVLGSGGHTAEMLALLKGLDFATYAPRHYVIADTDHTSAQRIVTFEEARTGHLVAVRVGRFALTHDGSTADVPCKSPTEAEGGSLPATSVHTTDRVIVGAIAEIAHRDDDLRKYGFAVDLQVNNGRAEAVTILAVRWEIIDANGLRQVSHGTVGDNGLGAIKLAPNSALRLRTTLPLLHTPSAKISGVLLARFEQPGEAVGLLNCFEGFSTFAAKPL